MPVRLIDRIDAIVAADPRAAAAARRLPAVVGTMEWPVAVRTYRSCANAALLGALWRTLLPRRSGRRAAEAGSAQDLLRTPVGDRDVASSLRP
jgi:hypothetical protein